LAKHVTDTLPDNHYQRRLVTNRIYHDNGTRHQTLCTFSV